MEETPKKIRRYDIDWLRVILFALLIWFHYAVFSLGILFESEGDIEDNLPLFFIVGVMHQWRLAALFVISGMGTAFAFKSRTWKVYIKERGIRLGVPLIFTIYILFFGIFEPIKKTILLFTIFPGSDDMPYGHLWFVYNLLIYSIILTPLFSHVRKNPDGRIINLVKYILKIRYGLGLLLIPPLILALNGILFKPWEFGEVGMWWEFSRYLLYFLFGYLMIMSKDAYFSVLDKIRLPITILTPILAAIWFISGELGDIPDLMEGGWVNSGYSAFSIWATIAALVQAFHAWFWCLFIFSWSSKLLNRPSKWLAYLNEAVYPTYIVHMHLTFLPIALFGILGLGYYLGLFLGTILVMFCVMICFEIARRATYARVLFGIKGGYEEVSKLYPYNKIQNRNIQTLFGIGAHFLVFIMVITLLLCLVSAGILGEE